MSRCQEDWECFGKCLADVWARTATQGVPACLGTGRKVMGVWQQAECALREIVCPRDVPDVDSHWFANREPQVPGAMSKQKRLPFSITGKWNWPGGGYIWKLQWSNNITTKNNKIMSNWNKCCVKGQQNNKGTKAPFRLQTQTAYVSIKDEGGFLTGNSVGTGNTHCHPPVLVNNSVFLIEGAATDSTIRNGTDRALQRWTTVLHNEGQ